MLVLLFVLVAIGYYLIVTSRRFVLHLIVIASFAVRVIGSMFKVLHWTGADEILAVSAVGFALGGFLLLWTGFRNPTRKVLYYQLIAGALILLTTMVSYFPVDSLQSVPGVLSGLVAITAGVIVFREEYVHQGEKNMLNMYIVITILTVINELQWFMLNF